MKRLIIIFFIIFSFLAWAGTKLDSLQKVFLHSNSDTQKINLLIYHVAPLLEKSNTDSAVKSYLLSIQLCQKGVKKATTDNLRFYYIVKLLYGIHKLSIFYDNNLNVKTSLAINNILYKLVKKINVFYPRELKPYLFLGDYYVTLGSFSDDTNKFLALKNYSIALKYYKLVYQFDTLSTEAIKTVWL